MYKKSKKLVSVGILVLFIAVTALPFFTEVDNCANDPVRTDSIVVIDNTLDDWLVSSEVEIASADDVDNIFVDDDIFNPVEENEIDTTVFEVVNEEPKPISLQTTSRKFSTPAQEEVSANDVIDEEVTVEDATEEEIVENESEKITEEEVVEEPVVVEETKEKVTKEDAGEPILMVADKSKIKDTKTEKKKKKDSGKTIYDVLPLDASVIDAIIETCAENDIPILNAIGIIDLESQFDVNARAGSGCYGLCQLNPRYFPKNLSPEDNVRYGINYLASHYKTYKDWTKAYNAYNAGHVTGDTKYANQVYNLIDKWKKVFDDAGIEY